MKIFRSGYESRTMNMGDIEYYYIPRELRGDDRSVFFPPTEFNNPLIEQLRRYPKNIFQLDKNSQLYEANKFSQLPLPIRFSVIFHESIDFALSELIGRLGIKVFFINPAIPGIEKTIQRLVKYFGLAYIVFVARPPFNWKKFKNEVVTSRNDFFNKLKRDAPRVSVILSEMAGRAITFEFAINEFPGFKGFNPFKHFKPSHTNYYILNQIIFNDWNGQWEEPDVSWDNESEGVIKGDKNDPSRLKTLIEQVDSIDKIEYNFIKLNHIQFPRGEQDWMSPLILIIPFNFPYLDIVFPSDETRDWSNLKKLMKMEQSLSYLYYNEERQEVAEEDVKEFAHLAHAKSSFLDEVGYLHSSFTLSPVVRFPHLGHSIKKELSFFKPESINDKKISRSRHHILKFGSALTNRILPNGLTAELFDIPRQLIAISDLPVEWLVHNNETISFTHDITRIPETPYGGSLSSFAVNSVFKLDISEDILKKTLVLFCATNDSDSPEFSKYFKSIEDLKLKLGFRTFKCYSVKDVIREVNEFQPSLLIFDCHGGFDKDTLSSYLYVNDEKITGHMIIKEKIFAPIVFLSACHTNPNYGYINRIADAFFEAGCLSVTATYFPITIRSGFYIYLRVLAGLDDVAKRPVHKNWLAYVSHILRTSYIMDVSTYSIEKVITSNLDAEQKQVLIDKIKQLTLEANIKMIPFRGRTEARDEFTKQLKLIIPKSLANIDSVVSEDAFYTNLGRGDLIRFKSWSDEYTKLNEFHQKRSSLDN